MILKNLLEVLQLNGKHIRIQKPLMAVVNIANYEFVAIDVGSYEHISDSGID